MKRKYTELEIELYEKLIQISTTFTKFAEEWKGRIRATKDINKIRVTFDEFVNLSNLIGDIEIPKKFLILNVLKNKNGN